MEPILLFYVTERKEVTSLSDERGRVIEQHVGHDGVGRAKAGWKWTSVCRGLVCRVHRRGVEHTLGGAQIGDFLKALTSQPQLCTYKYKARLTTQTGWTQLLEGGQVRHPISGHPWEAFAEADVPRGC